MLSFTTLAVTAAEATAYHALAAPTGWPVVEADQEAALYRGQRYIAARYNGLWLTDWDNDDAPDEVKHAISEAGLVEAVSPGKLSVTSTPAADKVLTEVNGIKWERVKLGGIDGWVPRNSTITGLLSGLVRSGATMHLSRA